MNKYFVSLFLALTTFDMGIKQYVEDTFRKGEERSTKDSRLVIRRVHNKGFCLDTLDSYPMLVKIVSAVLGGIIGADAYKMLQKRGQWVKKLGMTFLTAGAFSNIFDRICRGYVVDYIGVRVKNSKLSKITANLADIYILTGSAILFTVKAVSVKKAEECNGDTDKK